MHQFVPLACLTRSSADLACAMQIDYDDGDQEKLRIGLDCPVMVELPSGCEPPLPSLTYLQKLLDVLLHDIDNLNTEAQAAEPNSKVQKTAKAKGVCYRIHNSFPCSS